MLREQRGPQPTNTKANHQATNCVEVKASGLSSKENASPNHNSDNTKIKAWQGRRSSNIPSPPLVEAIAVTPKQGPALESPLPNERVTTLQAIKNQLQSRLDNERQKQIDAVKQLEYLGETDEKTANLNDEVCSRGTKIMVLSQKLTRTQHALGSLQKATHDYEASAKKVRDAEEVYLNRQKRSSGLSLTSKESKSIRHELDAATSMMNAACQRVEQIESITDALISQLSETEHELADLQNLRNTELIKHSAEIEKLAHERDCLALQLAASDSSSNELKEKQKDLNRRLAEAKMVAKKLAEELDRADKETEMKQQMFERELEQKQKDLEAAEKRAAEGTPKSKGAKEVLPMALKKLKGTLDELSSVKEEKDKATKDLEYARQLAKAREETLEEQLQVQTLQSQSLINEKQVALESMMKAAAAAANDAAVKQESINALRIEMATISESKKEIESEMNQAKHQCSELRQKLQLVLDQEKLAKDSIRSLQREYNEAKAASLEREIILKTQVEQQTALASDVKAKVSSLEREYNSLLKSKHEYEKLLGAKDAAIASLKAEIFSHQEHASMIEGKMKVDLEVAQESFDALNQETDSLRKELQISLVKVSELNFDLASLQASKNEITGLLQQKEDEIKSLSKDYAGKTHDLKAIIKEKDAKIVILERESASLRANHEQTRKELEMLQSSYKESSKKSAEDIAALSKQLETSQKEYQQLEEKFSKLEEESRSHLVAAEHEIDELRGQLADSLEIQKRLEESLILEKNTHASERRQLVEQCESLERSKDSLLRSIQGLDEQLALKESEIEATKLQGTPRGDTAKIVLQKTFEKVKSLKNTIETLTSECGQKDDLIAALRLETEQITILQANSRKMQSDIKDLTEEKHRSRMELDLRQSKIIDLEHELSEMKESLSIQTQAKDQLAEVMKDKISLLEEELCKQQEISKDLQSRKYEAEQRAKSLLDSLNETKQVLVALRHSEDSNSEVMQLSFLKIKNLEGDLAMQQLEIDELRNKLNDAALAEGNLQMMLSNAEDKHAVELESMSKTIHSLEGNVSRLRMELLDEVSKSNQMREKLHSVQSTNAACVGTIAELEGSLENMQLSMQDVERKLEEKESALSMVQAAKDSMLAEMTEKISDAAKQRDIAQESFNKATEEVSKITDNLHIARSQLQAYERSVMAKETTIASQKAMISELEGKTKDLTSDLEKSKLDIIKRDEKLKHLGQAKIQAEIQLAEDIQLLKQELEIQREKAKNVNLAEAAAQRSATLLDETQIRLSESEQSVHRLRDQAESLNNDLKTSQHQIALKSSQIIKLMQDLQEKTCAAQKMENAFIERQNDLHRALRSAEWLASVTKARYEDQIQKLSNKVDILEKRCMHVEALERQNAELCALVRERSNTPVQPDQLVSHRMEDVESIASPPLHIPSTRTAVAAVTTAVAGLAIFAASRTPSTR